MLALPPVSLSREEGDIEKAYRLNQEGVSLYNAKRYDDAKAVLQEALELRKSMLGSYHLDVAETSENLGSTLNALGDYTPARQLLEKALSIRKKLLNPHHPLVSRTLNNLAAHYDALKQYARAEAFLRQGIFYLERQFGPNDPSLAPLLANLGVELMRQDRLNEAEDPLLHAFHLDEKTLSAAHINISVDLNNLADLYFKRGETTKALPLYQRAAAIKDVVLGGDHRDTAKAFENLKMRTVTVLQDFQQQTSQSDNKASLKADALAQQAAQSWKDGKHLDAINLAEQSLTVYESIVALTTEKLQIF